MRFLLFVSALFVSPLLSFSSHSPDKYAFAANSGKGRMMDAITTELIRLTEEGVTEELKRKYFGEGHGYLSRFTFWE